MRIDFEDGGYIEFTRSKEPKKYFIIVAAKDVSSGDVQINSADVTDDEFHKLISEFTDKIIVEPVKKKATKKKAKKKTARKKTTKKKTTAKKMAKEKVEKVSNSIHLDEEDILQDKLGDIDEQNDGTKDIEQG